MSEDVEGERCSCGSSSQSQSGKELNQEQDELLEAFTLYDTDGDGLISIREIGTVMRALGQTPTICEETDIIAAFVIDQCNDIDFKAFRALMKKHMKEIDNDYELKESFRRFDKAETEAIDVEYLRSMLTTMGEPLTNAEVDSWLSDAQEFIENGNLRYEPFATVMLSK